MLMFCMKFGHYNYTIKYSILLLFLFTHNILITGSWKCAKYRVTEEVDL